MSPLSSELKSKPRKASAMKQAASRDNNLKSKLHYDWLSVGQSTLVSGTQLGPATNFSSFFKWSLYSCAFVYMERPLWREDGSGVYCSCWTSPAQSASSLAGLMTIFYCLEFENHKPGGQCSYIYFAQEQGNPEVEVEVEFTADSQSARQTSFRATIWSPWPDFFSVWHLRISWWRTPSLTRGWVCNLSHNCFWALTEQSLLGRSPAELTTIY
jgi:hypothetical protein